MPRTVSGTIDGLPIAARDIYTGGINWNTPVVDIGPYLKDGANEIVMEYSSSLTNAAIVANVSGATALGMHLRNWWLNYRQYNSYGPSQAVIKPYVEREYDGSAVPEYDVIFDSNGGSEVEAAVVVHGEKALQPDDPIRRGYTFTGWTRDGIAFDFDTAITRNTILTATWELVPITSLKIDAIAIVTVKRGDVRQFSATINEDATAEYLEWKTANPALAEVDVEGVVTVKNIIGTVVLTATDPASGRSHSVLLRIAS
jgi:uncharacterized repeat protein (TIGR02543 family)